MIRTDKRLRLCTALLVCNLVFIWGNSLMPGEISQAISDWVQSLLFGTQPSNGVPAAGNGLLRKAAHFTEFAALGFLFAWLFGMLQKKRKFAFLSGAAAACLDETLQSFTPERAPRILDVCIDCCGVITGMILLYLGHSYFQKKANHTPMEDT